MIDTTQLYPHSRGLPYRRALRFLVQEHLGTCKSGVSGIRLGYHLMFSFCSVIQDGGATGHSSLIDARAALDLVKAKARKLVENGDLQ